MKTMRRYFVADFFDITWKMAVPTVAGVALGYLADRAWQTSPLFFLIGAVLGFGGGIFLAIKAVQASRRLK